MGISVVHARSDFVIVKWHLRKVIHLSSAACTVCDSSWTARVLITDTQQNMYAAGKHPGRNIGYWIDMYQRFNQEQGGIC